MALAGLAGYLVLALGAVALLAGVVWFLLPLGERRSCPSCAAKNDLSNARCDVCGADLDAVKGYPGAAPYGFPAQIGKPRLTLRDEPRVEEGVAYNRGMTRKAVTLATACMGLGIGVRLVGMVGLLGLPAIPAVIDGGLTVVGGLVAFIGFVFLDAA